MGTIATVDHVKAAIGRLCSQFADKPKIIAWLTAMVGPAQPIENALMAILASQGIANSAGYQLDRIGRLLGLGRNGLSDADYQTALFAWVAVESSHGNVESLIGIVQSLLDNATAQIIVDVDALLAGGSSGSVTIRVLNVTIRDALANLMYDFLQKAVAGGVRVILETQYVPDAAQWMFAVASFASGALSIGQTSILAIIPSVSNGISGFPVIGSLDIDVGVAVQETVTYVGFTFDGIGILFHGVSALTQNHLSGACVQLSGSPGLGMGDTANSSTGGQFSSARSGRYTPVLTVVDQDGWTNQVRPIPPAIYQPLPLLGRSGNFRED